MKIILAALALSSAFSLASPASATVILTEGFDNITTLSSKGWVITNQSVPQGTNGWFQGNSGVFSSQSGSADSYIGANFNSVGVGGQLANWLITPEFSTATGGNITFWVRAEENSLYQDQMAFGFSTGSATTSDFAMASPQIVPQGAWNQISVAFAAAGQGATGRFAIKYTGPEASANYVGVDTLAINVADAAAAVPEPATWAMLIMGFGVTGCALRRSRTQRLGRKAAVLA